MKKNLTIPIMANSSVRPVSMLLGGREALDEFTHAIDNFEIKFTVTTYKTSGLITVRFRYINGTNFWVVNVDGDNALGLYSFVDNTPALYGYVGSDVTDGSIIKITCISNTIRVYVDNVLKITKTEATELSTGTGGLLVEMGTGGLVSDIFSYRINSIGNHIFPLIGGGQPAQTTLAQEYVDNDLGVFLHYNMSTYDGNQWATPNIDVDTFAPTGLDVNQWITAIATSGAKFATLTVKHHDGFSLYPTAHYAPGYDPYSIAQTAWYAANGSPDIVSLFVTACRNNNIIPCFYYSVWDRTYETRADATPTGDAGYLNLIETQLRELLSNYGDIGALWLDGYTGMALNAYIPYPHLYNFIKSLQSGCLIINNEHTFPPAFSQLYLYEVSVDGNVPESNTNPAEEANTVDVGGSWFFNPESMVLKSAATINASKAQANSRNAVYHINFLPNTVGVLPADQVALLGQLT